MSSIFNYNNFLLLSTALLFSTPRPLYNLNWNRLLIELQIAKMVGLFYRKTDQLFSTYSVGAKNCLTISCLYRLQNPTPDIDSTN